MKIEDYKVSIVEGIVPGEPNKIVIDELNLVIEAFGKNQKMEFLPTDIAFVVEIDDVAKVEALAFDVDFDQPDPSDFYFFKVIENDNLKNKRMIQLFIEAVDYYLKQHLHIEDGSMAPINGEAVYLPYYRSEGGYLHTFADYQQYFDSPVFNEYLGFDLNPNDCEPGLLDAIGEYQDKHYADQQGLTVEEYRKHQMDSLKMPTND